MTVPTRVGPGECKTFRGIGVKNEPFAFERMAHRMLQEALEQRVNALPQGGARTVSQMPRKEAEVEQYHNPARRKTLVRLKANKTYRYVPLLTPTRCC